MRSQVPEEAQWRRPAGCDWRAWRGGETQGQPGRVSTGWGGGLGLSADRSPRRSSRPPRGWATLGRGLERGGSALTQGPGLRESPLGKDGQTLRPPSQAVAVHTEETSTCPSGCVAQLCLQSANWCGVPKGTP